MSLLNFAITYLNLVVEETKDNDERQKATQKDKRKTKTRPTNNNARDKRHEYAAAWFMYMLVRFASPVCWY